MTSDSPDPSHGEPQRSVPAEEGQSLAQEALVGLFSATDAVRRFIFDEFERHDITQQQYTVLKILSESTEDGLPTLEIGDRMLERTPGVTRLIDRLVRKNLVQRSRSNRDRRVVKCRLTKAGEMVVGRLSKPINTANQAAMAALNDVELTQLIDLLTRIRTGD